MKLKRVKQCAKCPWKKSVNPRDIPNGYNQEHHEGLRKTIAERDNPFSTIGPELRIMACHQTDKAHCVGWLNNQLGEGGNIGLRISMMNCENISKLKIVGEQHQSFDETLPS
jgi:hypothetical protein